MSNVPSISTKKLKNRRTVDIEGHVYTVRQFGNLEQLDNDEFMIRLGKLAAEEEALGEGVSLSDEKLAEVNELTRKITLAFVELFDDGGDQSKSYKLIASLDGEEMTELLKLVFKESNDTPTAAS